MQAERMTPAPLQILVVGRTNRAGRCHIAAHPPSGYGMRALCGVSWRETHYRIVEADASTDVLLCRRCESLGTTN